MMEITKLYTLSQFVELIGTKRLHEFENINKAEKYRLIVKYNNFLKQPLTKGMFINPVEYPFDIYYRPNEGVQKFPQECYENSLNDWQEAEKKVIFKNFRQCSSSALIHENLRLTINEDKICHYSCYLETINDLANLTKGQLEINLGL